MRPEEELRAVLNPDPSPYAVHVKDMLSKVQQVTVDGVANKQRRCHEALLSDR